MPRKSALRKPAALLTLAAALSAGSARAESPGSLGWIPVCGQCLAPAVTARTGVGTAHAAAEGKVTLEAARDYCENRSPDQDCAREAARTMKEEGGRVYRIRADCVHGTVTDTDGESYRYAGIWPEGFGKGRSRWRDSSGHVVATTEVANGLALSAIGELLCPAGFATAAAARRPR